MHDHTKLRAFELAERDAPKCDSKMVETEKVLSALIRAMRNH